MNRIISPKHLERKAYIYIRQSTLTQLKKNQESTKRQYALREKAMSLGWSSKMIHIIDSDLGKSGTTSKERTGFKKLISEVATQNVGIVMGLEVSRLARDCEDWHHLIKLCILTSTLISDEQGVYDPKTPNDHLLLGFKGSISEAELYFLRSRLQGGLLNKAKRGELRIPIPTGFVYNENDQAVLDPDQQVQNRIRYLFKLFRREGSAGGVARSFWKENLTFPKRLQKGPNKGDLIWIPLSKQIVLRILKNPRYAGIYVFGRSQTDMNGRKNVPQEKWIVKIPDSHEGYISKEEYEENQNRIQDNRTVGEKSFPREGSALLQGITICGLCGRSMKVHYHTRRKNIRIPNYVCKKGDYGRKCQFVCGKTIETAISQKIIDIVTPMTLDLALAVEQEVQARREEVNRLHRQELDRAEYEEEQAKRRYMNVDPSNRLVASTLELKWNKKLEALEKAKQEYDKRCQKEITNLKLEQEKKIRELTHDFPKAWSNPKTPYSQRKRMLRLFIEDVTITKMKDEIALQIRFKGGAVEEINVPKPLPIYEQKRTDSNILKQIEELTKRHTHSQVATILNKNGYRTHRNLLFTGKAVRGLATRYRIKSFEQHLREQGALTANELAKKLNTSTYNIKKKFKEGKIKGWLCNDKGTCVYLCSVES